MIYHNLEVKNISLTIAPYKLHALSTTSFGLDGGAMFGTVPKVLWSRTNPADEKNRILMDCRCLLLQNQETSENILIDTGLGGDFVEKYGPKLGPKFAEMYGVQSGQDSGLLKALRNLGLNSEDIHHVILTHLHFDHAGGATKFKDGKIVPTFENAKYYVQKENFETACRPNLREKASYYDCNFLPLKKAGCLSLLKGECEILSKIKVSLTHGHTAGQQTVWVENSSKALLYCADLIPTASHVRLPWVMGYDLDPLKIITEKKAALTKALEKETYLFFEHDPYCSLALIEKQENRPDYKLKEIFNLSCAQ